ncbi:MAG TPA: helix-turn-helix transcriptional regulator, partial [bacterium]|nr:helix-turn-helix transcriptional regulator [bacterium]
LGTRLRGAREDLGYSQAQLAERAGVSPGLVGQIERGEVQPSLLTLDNLASALGVSPCYLIQEEDPAAFYSHLSPAVRKLLAQPQAQAVLERICSCTENEVRFILEFLNLYKQHHCPEAD